MIELILSLILIGVATGLSVLFSVETQLTRILVELRKANVGIDKSENRGTNNQ